MSRTFKTGRPTHVAGRGLITGFGAGRCRTLDAVFAGRTALRERTRTAEIECASRVAAEVPRDGDPPVSAPLAYARRVAIEALAEAGKPDPAGVGLVVATTKADLSGIGVEGQGFGSPGRLAAWLAADLGLGGPRHALSCACASGLSAIALAARRIERGEERVLVVGVDELNAFVLRGFSAMYALDPEPCRPFDRTRRGLSLGEGAAALLLSASETESIGVRVAGCGEANEAHHVTGPDPEGGGLSMAVQRALDDGGFVPGDVDVVHAHGTGTPYNDAMEARGLTRVFEGTTPPTFGTKAQTGHTLGAAGVLESMIAIEALRRGEAPANVGLAETDVVPSLALTTAATPLPRARVALKVSGGFGGIQAAAVFSC